MPAEPPPAEGGGSPVPPLPVPTRPVTGVVDLAELAAELTALEEELGAAREDAERARREADALRHRMSSDDSDVRRGNEELVALRAGLRDAINALKRAQGEATSHREAAEQATAQTAALTERYRQLAHAYNALQQEVERLRSAPPALPPSDVAPAAHAPEAAPAETGPVAEDDVAPADETDAQGDTEGAVAAEADVDTETYAGADVDAEADVAADGSDDPAVLSGEVEADDQDDIAAEDEDDVAEAAADALRALLAEQPTSPDEPLRDPDPDPDPHPTARFSLDLDLDPDPAPGADAHLSPEQDQDQDQDQDGAPLDGVPDAAWAEDPGPDPDGALDHLPDHDATPDAGPPDWAAAVPVDEDRQAQDGPGAARPAVDVTPAGANLDVTLDELMAADGRPDLVDAAPDAPLPDGAPPVDSLTAWTTSSPPARADEDAAREPEEGESDQGERPRPPAPSMDVLPGPQAGGRRRWLRRKR